MFLSSALLMYWQVCKRNKGKRSFGLAHQGWWRKHLDFFVRATATVGCWCPSLEWLGMEREDRLCLLIIAVVYYFAVVLEECRGDPLSFSPWNCVVASFCRSLFGGLLLYSV
jgi:hypothetical protein